MQLGRISRIKASKSIHSISTKTDGSISVGLQSSWVIDWFDIRHSGIHSVNEINDFKSIHNAALIGFDELFNKLRELEKPQTGFPPYDIIKESEENFVIKLAVAGYKKDHINGTHSTSNIIRCFKSHYLHFLCRRNPPRFF